MIKQLITIDAVPVAQPRHRSTRSGFHYQAAKDHPIYAFKKLCMHRYREHNDSWVPDSGLAVVRLVFVFPRPKRIKEPRRTPHRVKPDIDNLCKAVMDALSGVAWQDDKSIHRLEAEKWYASIDEQPHVELTISRH